MIAYDTFVIIIHIICDSSSCSANKVKHSLLSATEHCQSHSSQSHNSKDQM